MTTTPPVRDKAAELAALHKVQRRVGAIAFFAVAIHGVLGLVVVARHVDGEGRHGDARMLLVMSAVFALVTLTVVRIILQKSPWAPLWIVVALVPTVFGFFWAV